MSSDDFTVLAKTEPATTGGQPKVVLVSKMGGTLLITEVEHSGDATASPLPDLADLPTVSWTLHENDLQQ